MPISLHGPVNVADTSLPLSSSCLSLQCTLGAAVPPRASQRATLGKCITSDWPACRLSTVLDTSPCSACRPAWPASVGDSLSEPSRQAASRFAGAPSEHVRPAPSGMGKHRQASLVAHLQLTQGMRSEQYPSSMWWRAHAPFFFPRCSVAGGDFAVITSICPCPTTTGPI